MTRPIEVTNVKELASTASEPKERRWASIEKVDNGYIVNLEATGKTFLNMKLVENRLKRAVGVIATFMEAIDEKETT